MEYLRLREQKLRDTNESTNERVKWFALGTMGMLVGLGAWQVVYLRAYFRYVIRVGSRWGSLTFGIGRSISSRCSRRGWLLAGLEERRKGVKYDFSG
jgi:emp24/gp25L/p24 family/GOLD